MSDVNSIELDLYVRDTLSYRPATFEETLHAARRALAQRFRPGRSLRSPELVQEYLRFALASKEYEVFCLIGLDLCAGVSYVEPGAIGPMFLGISVLPAPHN